MSKTIAYYRVSTKHQGRSGLGLEAQKAAVKAHVGQPDDHYIEIESGRCTERPQLRRAIEECKRTGAKLIVAKLDRLSRSMRFTSELLDSGVDFVCCDMPSANRLTIHIIAAIAEEESRLVSERTKAALTAAKARGVKLGGARGGGWVKSSRKEELKTQKLKKSYGEVLPLILSLRDRGVSYGKIADELNSHGYRPPKSERFTKNIVCNILKRLENLCVTTGV